VLLNEDDWIFLLNKYEKLYHSIANKFYSGDPMYSHDDFVEELKLHTYEIVKGFSKHIGLSCFDDFKDSKEFDKYYKTSLWYKRNNLGTKTNTKQYEGFVIQNITSIANKTFDSNDGIGHDIEDLGGISTGSVYPAYREIELPTKIIDVKLNKDQKKLIDLVVHDYSYYKPNGNINATMVCKSLGWSYPKFKIVLESLKKPFEQYKNVEEA
jgi:hypothetical protein